MFEVISRQNYFQIKHRLGLSALFPVDAATSFQLSEKSASLLTKFGTGFFLDYNWESYI
jgi:hypothetical protein